MSEDQIYSQPDFDDYLVALVPDEHFSKDYLTESDEHIRLEEHDESGLAQFTDIEFRKFLSDKVEELEEQAFFDPLTKLYTRNGVVEAIKEVISHYKRENFLLTGDIEYEPEGLLFLVDLDNLTDVNEKYTHAGGDAAIRTTSARFKENVRPVIDIAGRFGGDEYIGILPQDAEISKEDADKLVERLRRTIDGPVTLEDGTEFMAYASVGYLQDEEGNPQTLPLSQYLVLGSKQGEDLVKKISDAMKADKRLQKATRRIRPK